MSFRKYELGNTNWFLLYSWLIFISYHEERHKFFWMKYMRCVQLKNCRSIKGAGSGSNKWVKSQTINNSFQLLGGGPKWLYYNSFATEKKKGLLRKFAGYILSNYPIVEMPRVILSQKWHMYETLARQKFRDCPELKTISCMR